MLARWLRRLCGMQDLVDAIRSVGAYQPIVLSGLDWGGDLRGWLQHQPADPADALVAGAHVYDFKRCATKSCWGQEIGAVAAEVPVILTEFGDTDCTGDFSKELMAWADVAGVSYLAWTWNPWDCAGGPAVISSFDGQSTPYGEVVRRHLKALMPPFGLPPLLPHGMLPS
jgi:endoglucanase